MGRLPTSSHSTGLGVLDKDLEEYANLSLSINTKKTYRTAEKRLVEFCRNFNISDGHPIPATESTLCYFAAYLAKTVKHDTIKAYLSAIKHFHLINNYDLDLDKCVRLQYILRGIKRSQSISPRTRLPISEDHLEKFYLLLQPTTSQNRDSKMIWAAMCLAFFGFLRTSEFTQESALQGSEHLSPNDVKFLPSNSNATHMTVKIKGSKTDPFRKGVQLTIGATQSHICAVKALQDYMQYRGFCPGPLFLYLNGSSLSRALFVSEIKQLLAFAGYARKSYNGHSFRIGAATSAAAKGLPPWLIKTMGRWTSDCYERYIRTPDTILIKASQTIIQ